MTTRRNFNLALLGGASALAAPMIARAAPPALPRLTWATFTPGFVPAFMQHTINRGFDREHGVQLAAPLPYSSLTSYYGDFVAGAFDMCFGSWETFAVRSLGGVPMRYLCGINPGDLLNIVTLSDKIQSLEDLRGKTVAATTTSGTFRLLKGLVQKFYGFDLEKETSIQTVDHPLAGVTLVLADRADAAVTWEPSVTMGMSRNPNLRVLLNMGEAYRKHEGAEMPFLGLAIRQEALDRNPGIERSLWKIFAKGADAMNAEPRKAYEAAANDIGLPPDILVKATESGRLKYRFASMADEADRNAVIRSSRILSEAQGLQRAVDQKFFAT